MTPSWILDVLAALMLVVAAVSAARLAEARPWQRGSVVTDTDAAHLLMAVAMAGMLTTRLITLPDTAWEVIFGLMTAWFGYRVVRDARANGVRALAGGHCAPHLVHSGAMLYMFLAVAASAGAGSQAMTGMAGSARTLAYPTLALAFALTLVGYGIWDVDQVSSRRYRVTRSPVLVAAGASVPVLAGTEPATVPMSAPQGNFLLSPATTVGCRITMGVTMAFMLLIMI